MADGLPAFGIVAAVLGVIKALAAVDQPPAIPGDLISKAMVGTLLGILLAYGFVGPLARASTAARPRRSRCWNASRPRCWPA